MSSLLEGNEEQLERELTGEPFAKPATGSVVLHAFLTLAIVLYYILGASFIPTCGAGRPRAERSA